MGDAGHQWRYQPPYKPNQLICGTGQTVVVTGWTVKEAVAKYLQPQDYAAIGQLYSPTRGISVLLRNLIANPHVRYLMVLNATREDQNAGACTCLLDFFRHGFSAGTTNTGRPCWLIHSPIVGYIDAEIPEWVLRQLQQVLIWQEADQIPQAVAWVQQSAQRALPAWEPPQREFPQAQVESRVRPGPRYGHRIVGRTIAETWVKIIHRVKTTGTIRPTAYDGQWQELINLTAIVTHEPPEFYFPQPNYLPIDRAFLQDYIQQILADSPQREGVKYTYGQRLRSWFGRDQIQQVIDKLTHDPDSARAVMSLWDVQDHERGDSPPCLNHIWVRIVDRQISLTATFRSNDMFSAWPANAMGLRALQQHIQQQILAEKPELNLVSGPLMIVSQSAHIYDDCWENADQVIANHYLAIHRQRDYDDPIGNFVITLQNDQIAVEHLTPGNGEVLECYSSRSARWLYQQIAANCPALEVEHALYLGMELQKAELALHFPNQWSYGQDQPLRPA